MSDERDLLHALAQRNSIGLAGNRINNECVIGKIGDDVLLEEQHGTGVGVAKGVGRNDQVIRSRDEHIGDGISKRRLGVQELDGAEVRWQKNVFSNNRIGQERGSAGIRFE